MFEVVLTHTAVRTMAKLRTRDARRFERVERTLDRLRDDPWQPALASKRYRGSREVWQSYVEQATPAAWRIWWELDGETITVLEIGPHP